MARNKETGRTGWQEAGGLFLLALCVLMFLSLASYDSGDIGLIQSPPNEPEVNFIGTVGAWFGFVVFMLLGVCGYLVPVVVGVEGLLLMFCREGRTWPKVVWMIVIVLTLICLAELQTDLWGALSHKLNIGSPGGLIGQIIAGRWFIRVMGEVGTAILATAILLVALVLLFEIAPIVVLRYLGALATGLYRRVDAVLAERRDRRSQIDHEAKELAKQRRRLEQAVRSQEGEAPKTRRIAAQLTVQPSSREEKRVSRPSQPPARKEVSPKREAKASSVAPFEGGPSSYTLPTLAVLDPPPPASQREIKEDFQTTARILQETLAEFGIETEVTNVEKGPVVTRYELLPAPGVKLNRISNLSDNIALAMKASAVRVQAPIPGKGVVGIEVPNSKTTLVYLREVLEGDRWLAGEAALPLALGKDVGGNEIVSDLAEMPHLLIAGATGSGKTVCINSILAGLLMSRTPDEMRLMLIDPKIVEFSVYKNLPHLVVPVVTDAKKVNLGLRWAINEMEKRYKLFAKVGVRNIQSYNSRPIVKQEELFGEPEEEGDKSNEPPARLAYLVIVIDELADLMLVAQAEIENSIARLAQLSRAVGIHMILATQRPSVNVITGTIKANFPARLAFQVAQKVDSRTILDANGADKLLGKGDMLFLPPGSSKLVRAQGTMTQDQEIQRIVAHYKRQGQPDYEVSIKEKMESSSVNLPEMEEDDELLAQATEIIRQTHRASTSSLQRRLRIGYTRAARLMDVLEERGVVGPPRGSEPREILIDLDGGIPENEDEPVK